MSRKKSTATPAPEVIPTPETPVENPSKDQVTLMGRLTADPVLRTTKSAGKAVSTIRLAVNDGPTSTFHNVVVWGRTAEVVCQYLKKGRSVQVDGRTQQRAWTGSDGSERTTTEVNAYRVQFLNARATAPVDEKALS